MTNLGHANWCGCHYCSDEHKIGSETKRERVKDALVASFLEKMEGDGFVTYERAEVYEWACDVADRIFETLKIPPNEQDKP